MKNRTALRARTVTGLVAVSLAGSLALAGCSGDDKGSSSTPSGTSTTASAEATTNPADVAALAKVKISGAVGKKPTLTVPKGFTVTGAVARVDTPGTGAAIKDGDLLQVRVAIAQGSDGQTVSDNYAGDPQDIPYSSTSLIPALVDALKGQKLGVRVLFANQGQDSSGTAATYVYSLEVQKAIPTRATGTAVTPKAGLPTVKLDASTGEPSITIPKDYKAPKDVVAQTLIKGSGKKVTATSSVTAQYAGWTFDGKSFDSSWSRDALPAAFTLGTGVIEGWTKGLAGQTVGSQVLLVIPADQAYGDSPPDGSNIPKNAPLVFVVDILDAQSAS